MQDALEVVKKEKAQGMKGKPKPSPRLNSMEDITPTAHASKATDSTAFRHDQSRSANNPVQLPISVYHTRQLRNGFVPQIHNANASYVDNGVPQWAGPQQPYYNPYASYPAHQPATNAPPMISFLPDQLTFLKREGCPLPVPVSMPAVQH